MPDPIFLPHYPQFPQTFLAYFSVYVYHDAHRRRLIMPVHSKPFIRKQYLVSQQNISKLARLAKHKRTSVTAIVRQAIEAYDPDGLNELGEQQLMALVSIRLKEAIQDTQATRQKLNKTLKALTRT
jgi:hypothetical protein